MSVPTPELDAAARRACAVYPRVRDAVLAVMSAAVPANGSGVPSRYWQEELENIDYLLDASPLILRKLRHHAVHLTNLRPYDYRTKQDGRRENFTARLQALRAIGSDTLLVPESPALGGFGYEVDGRLFNVDTLKFYEVLCGLQLAGCLSGFDDRRRMVWEIGAGWGGFGYQFKTLFPNTTYVITDLPELFLFSAVYLMTVFPDARVLFVGADVGADAGANVAAWREADFVFVPNTLTDVIATAPIDLAINMVSFQEMTTAQVRDYTAVAARAGCPSFYSLNRDRSPYNDQLTSVADVLGEQYDLRELQVLDTEYTTALKKAPAGNKSSDRSPIGYRHLAGSLRSADTRAVRAGALIRQPTASPDPGPQTPAPVALAMTLHNNAGFLREAANSILSQTYGHFVLLMLDDGSSDETERIALELARHDPRVRYARHATRQGMVPTWREAAARALALVPGAEYFAWVSDHDRWHPDWLARMKAELDAHPEAVLAYPATRRIDAHGAPGAKEPRAFETAGVVDPVARWNAFCHEGTGSGDMVYGLMRAPAMLAAGTFRPVLNPDRLLVAELLLQGQIRQVDAVLWFRRDSGAPSISRQRSTLFAGQTPPGFFLPAVTQHVVLLAREYIRAANPPVRLPGLQVCAMLLRYQVSSAWRHYRKTDVSKRFGRGVDDAHLVKKLVKKGARLTVYHTLVGGRTLLAKGRRLRRKAVYEVLVFAHRMFDRQPTGPS